VSSIRGKIVRRWDIFTHGRENRRVGIIGMALSTNSHTSIPMVLSQTRPSICVGTHVLITAVATHTGDCFEARSHPRGTVEAHLPAAGACTKMTDVAITTQHGCSVTIVKVLSPGCPIFKRSIGTTRKSTMTARTVARWSNILGIKCIAFRHGNDEGQYRQGCNRCKNCCLFHNTSLFLLFLKKLITRMIPGLISAGHHPLSTLKQ
jgi:hypothetical protein